MLRAAVEWAKACGHSFLDGKFSVKEVPPDFDPDLERLRKLLEQ